MVERFKQLWRILNIDYDHFIRTTDEEHIEGVQKIFTKVKEKGDIYLGEYCRPLLHFLRKFHPRQRRGNGRRQKDLPRLRAADR